MLIHNTIGITGVEPISKNYELFILPIKLYPKYYTTGTNRIWTCIIWICNPMHNHYTIVPFLLIAKRSKNKGSRTWTYTGDFEDHCPIIKRYPFGLSGVEPLLHAYQTCILPLNYKPFYTRTFGVGIEPTVHCLTDNCFHHLATQKLVYTINQFKMAFNPKSSPHLKRYTLNTYLSLLNIIMCISYLIVPQ